jgi:hypothetical protein
MITQSKDLLINWGKVPDEESEEYNAFWRAERKKCQEGITIDGVFVNGFLYWHCNLWTIISDHITKGRVQQHPTFRDSEWVITNKIWEAKHFTTPEGNRSPKGVIAAGTRRFAKSEIEASFCAWEAICWKNAQVLVSGLNEPDIKIITDKIDLGINGLPNYFMKSKIEDNWKKQVTLGIKDKVTDQRIPWSTFAIRNFNNGNNEEALAGLTPSAGVIDEGGKGNFLKALLAGLPGLTTPNGWRGTFLVMGTGGDMESFRDFQTIFDDPDPYNFLSVEIPEENRKCGLFLPGWMAYSYPKEKKSFSNFLNLDEKKHPNLSKIDILVSDKEKNELIIDKQRSELANSNDPSALIKHIMYYPKNSREIFLSASNSKFNIKELKAHKDWLTKEYKPVYVDFYRTTNGKVDFTFSEKTPIIKFPVEPKDKKEAPICIYEHPVDNAPFGTYVIGIDPVNNNESFDRVVSLASIYVYKRMLSPLDKFKNQIVASWAGRFDRLEDFHNLALMISEYYNAVKSVLPEASENTLIQYYFHKKKGHYLADSFELLKELSANKFKGNQSKKGLPATPQYQNHYMNLMYEYCNEEEIIVDEEGNEQFILGLSKIYDPMLLEEMINYKGKTSGKGVHDGNFDRIISFGCCLTLAKYYDIEFPIANQSYKQPSVNDVIGQKSSFKTMFGTIQKSSPFVDKGYKTSTPRWLRR